MKISVYLQVQKIPDFQCGLRLLDLTVYLFKWKEKNSERWALLCFPRYLTFEGHLHLQMVACRGQYVHTALQDMIETLN